MPLQISGKNIEVTSSLQQYVEEKIGGVRKYFSDIQKFQVSLSVDHHHNKGEKVHRIDITMHVPKEIFHVHVQASEMHEAIDKASAKLQQHIKRYKKRFDAQDRATLRRLKETVLTWPTAFMRKTSHDTNTPKRRDGERIDEGMISERVAVPYVKPMTEEEALIRWEQRGGSTFLFVHERNQKPAVLSRDAQNRIVLAYLDL